MIDEEIAVHLLAYDLVLPKLKART